MVDASEGILGLEWIEGHSVRQLLPGGEEPEEADSEGVLSETPDEPDGLQEYGIDVGRSFWSCEPCYANNGWYGQYGLTLCMIMDRLSAGSIVRSR